MNTAFDGEPALTRPERAGVLMAMSAIAEATKNNAEMLSCSCSAPCVDLALDEKQAPRCDEARLLAMAHEASTLIAKMLDDDAARG